MERRTLLVGFVRGLGLLTAGVVGLPALMTGLAPVFDRRREGELWQTLGPLEQFPVGDMRRAAYEMPRDDWAEKPRRRGIYVWRKGPDELAVFSRNCTDLSCPVTWDPGSEWFLCPCHGGIFSKEGEPQAGPPSRPLYRYAYRIRNGELEIDLYSIPPMA